MLDRITMKIQRSYGNLYQTRHQFITHMLKRVNMFFMPCPRELQIRLMGQVCRRFATELTNCPSDAGIHERVMNFGPFIRTAVCWSSDEKKRYIKDRQEEIEGLVSDPTKLRSQIQVMQPATGKSLSHRSVQIVVHPSLDTLMKIMSSAVTMFLD